METVRIGEISAAWLTEHLPAVAEAIASVAVDVERAAAETRLSAAVSKARTEAATAERERILGVSELAAGDRELRDRMVRDPNTTPAQAALEIMRARSTARSSRIQALEDDERDLVPPTPGPTSEWSVKLAAKDAVALAARLGVIP